MTPGLEWLNHGITEKGVTTREFTLKRNHRPVPGVLWSPEQGSPGKPLILLGHGASGDRFQAPVKSMAYRMVRHYGFFALAIDGPVHGGRSTGDGARGSFAEEWKRPGNVEDMISDWKTAMDSIMALDEVGQCPVGYWGLSMGTIYGAPLVAAEPRIKAAVLGLMGLVGPTEAYRKIIKEAAEAIICPVLFLWQLEDELFPRDRCLALFDLIASKNKRLHANPGTHAAVPVEEMDFSESFLAEYV
ncbi:MAG: alpha/beta hydrolase [Desulfobacteraceae bacterium]|nr:alpha/beta hydrolase [Desulfobacteraceae bacterium]MBU4001230.1 alpha/beta hydrolase [Pseudomonadota bacterium]